MILYGRYQYILNYATKIEKNLWWTQIFYNKKSSSKIAIIPQESIKFCIPLIIKILNKGHYLNI